MHLREHVLSGAAMMLFPLLGAAQCGFSTVSQAGTGATTVYTCPGDGNPDAITAQSEHLGTAMYGYAVTDGNGIILGFPPTATVDVEGAGPGNCRIYGFSYTGSIIASVGDDITLVDIASGCCILSSNYILTVRDMPDGGMVNSNGATTVYTCPGDGNADVVMAANSSMSTSQYRYVVTDAVGIIVGLPPGNMVDVEGAGPGNCRIYGLSYTGNFTAGVGMDVTMAMFSDDCFDLSDNYILTVRDMPDGGMVNSNGATTVYTCPGDGNADVVMAANSSMSTSQYRYVVTDAVGIIVGLPPGNMVDVEGAGPGNCRIYGLSYTGNFTAGVGMDVTMAMFSDDCFDLSDNYILTVRDMPDGGMVNSNGATTVYTCPGDGNADVVMAANSSMSTSQYRYLVTDAVGIIVGLPPGNMVDVEGAGPGNCRIYGLSYTGNFTAGVGMDVTMAMFSDDCFDLSDNYILTVRDMPDGGMVNSNGATTVYTCPGDGNADVVMAANSSMSTSQYRYVVTDAVGIIVGLPPGNMVDVEGAGPGNCRIYGLSYTGNFTAGVGMDVTMAMFSDDCFDLSDNYILTVRDMPDGGNVTTAGGETMIVTAPGDGVSDVIEFAHTTASTSAYRYVVTDEAGIILGLPPANMVDFEDAGEGTCLVWGLSYTGNITAQIGDDATMVPLTDDCFELSADFVTVVRAIPDGDMITTGGGQVALSVIIDGNADVIDFVNTSTSAAAYAYIVTDEANVVLAAPFTSSFDFETLGPITSRVWGISYTGELTVQEGDDATAADLSTGGFDLSTNFVEVIGSLSTGLNERTSVDFTLWPVPTSDVLNVRTGDGSAIQAARILDLQGRVVAERSVYDAEVLSIDVQAIGAGTYVIDLRTTSGQARLRFVKR